MLLNEVEMTTAPASPPKTAASRPMIALNGRFSGTKQPTGTQTVAYNLFDAIVRSPREVDLTIFADSRFLSIAAWKDFPGVRWIEVPFQDWRRSVAQLW